MTDHSCPLLQQMHHAVTVDLCVGWSGRGKLLIPVDLRYNKISELLKRMTEVVFDICAKIHEMDIRVKKSILHTWDIIYRSWKKLTGHREIDNELN